MMSLLDNVLSALELPTLKEPTFDDVRIAAMEIHDSGISLMPALENGSKRPDGPWKQRQTTRPEDAEVKRWFGWRRRHSGLGIFCGEVSGNLDTLEFDDREVFIRFVALAGQSGLEPILRRIWEGWTDGSPRGGVHLYYRCSPVPGNTKLARRLTDRQIVDKNGNPIVNRDGSPRTLIVTLIETRGSGGWIIVAPSFGKVHDTGRPYRRLAGGPHTAAVIGPEDREALWEIARSLDEMPRTEAIPAMARRAPERSQDASTASEDLEPGRNRPKPGGRAAGRSWKVLPGEDFNARAAWTEILKGWTLDHFEGEVQYWRRPGKSKGWSASLNKNGSDRLYVFSSSTEFDPEKAYSKFAALATLEYGGDFSLAACALADQGYGVPTSIPPPHPAAPIHAPIPGSILCPTGAVSTLGNGPPDPKSHLSTNGRPRQSRDGGCAVPTSPGNMDDDETPLPIREWPGPPDPIIYHGLAGELVRQLEPHTESDPLAILVQLMSAFGNLVGRSAYFSVEADRHFANLFVALIGPSAKGRKGTSWNHAKRLLQSVDEDWAKSRIVGGLSSGEGLIYAVRDPVSKREPIRAGKAKGAPIIGYEEILADVGETDKRLLALEPELASVLKVISRDGNTLSALLRRCWDDGNLRTLIKNNPNVATDAHVSIIGHITKDELQTLLTNTEAANGFGNRFLWFCVRRSKLLPFGGLAHLVDFSRSVQRLAEVAHVARSRGEVPRDGSADELWLQSYFGLTQGKPGLLGAILGRSEPQVMRLALIYALLDGTAWISRVHLEAALALWKYAEQSADYVFGDALGDEDADAILAALRRIPEGLTRSEIRRDLFGGHKSNQELGRSLARLLESGLVCRRMVSTGGRPAEKWFVNLQEQELPS